MIGRICKLEEHGDIPRAAGSKRLMRRIGTRCVHVKSCTAWSFDCRAPQHQHIMRSRYSTHLVARSEQAPHVLDMIFSQGGGEKGVSILLFYSHRPPKSIHFDFFSVKSSYINTFTV
jgi:hypothetical protein